MCIIFQFMLIMLNRLFKINTTLLNKGITLTYDFKKEEKEQEEAYYYLVSISDWNKV